MALYQDTNALDPENFAGFAFTQANDDPSIPIVDNILPQVPPSDYRAATDFYNAISTLIDDLQKFQEDLSIIHNILLSERFPSPEVTRTRISQLQLHVAKMAELAVSSGIAALNSENDSVGTTLWMNLGGLGHGGEDQVNVNRTFQKIEGMKKSANAVVSVLKRV